MLLQPEAPHNADAHTAPLIITQIGAIFLTRQHLWTIFCDGDGVLEVGAVTSVVGDGGPAVFEDVNFGPPGVDHGLNREDHAGLETGAFAAVAEVRNLGIFVHGTANAMADELADDTEALGLAELLDDGGDIAEATADLALLNGLFKGGEGDIEELAGLRADLSDGIGYGSVGVETVNDNAAVDGKDVPFGEDSKCRALRGSRGSP